METPKLVLHDGEKWRVVREEEVDDEPGYVLSPMRFGKVEGMHIWARKKDVVAWAPQRTRRLKDHDIVLEYNSRGQVFVRKTRSRKRFETSLPAIYSMTVKAHVAMEKSLKAAAKRKGKRK